MDSGELTRGDVELEAKGRAMPRPWLRPTPSTGGVGAVSSSPVLSVMSRARVSSLKDTETDGTRAYPGRCRVENWCVGVGVLIEEAGNGESSFKSPFFSGVDIVCHGTASCDQPCDKVRQNHARIRVDGKKACGHLQTQWMGIVGALIGASRKKVKQVQSFGGSVMGAAAGPRTIYC